MSTRLPSYTGSISFNGIDSPQARQIVLVAIMLGRRIVSIIVPRVDAWSARTALTINGCGETPPSLMARLGGSIPSSTLILCKEAHAEICQNSQVRKYPNFIRRHAISEGHSFSGGERGARRSAIPQCDEARSG